jgi:hypothetical protein
MLKKLLIVLIFSIYSYGSFDQETTQLKDINKDGAVINIGNLKIGQSGIVVHDYDEKDSIIVANAIVLSSTNNSSKIKFIKFDDLAQNALPTTKLAPVQNDTLVLNYLYSKSLLIAPNTQAYRSVEENLPSQTFLNSDIFASYLKLDANPTPNKDDFISFCKKHNLGTIYVVIDNKFYILDAKSFKLLDTLPISYQDTKEELPFYTRVDKIEKNSFAWFQDSSIGDYKSYYNKLLGLK